MTVPQQPIPLVPAAPVTVALPLDIDLDAPSLDIDLEALAAGALGSRLFDTGATADAGRPSNGWRTQPAVHHRS